LSAGGFARSATLQFDLACPSGAECDYGLGSLTYAYDANIAFPASPWRALPTIANDDPDALPIAN
jgi:hypothetical protein